MPSAATSGDILLLETPFFSQTGNEEVRAYVQSKYNLALLALGSYIRAHGDMSVYLISMVKAASAKRTSSPGCGPLRHASSASRSTPTTLPTPARSSPG